LLEDDGFAVQDAAITELDDELEVAIRNLNATVETVGPKVHEYLRLPDSEWGPFRDRFRQSLRERSVEALERDGGGPLPVSRQRTRRLAVTADSGDVVYTGPSSLYLSGGAVFDTPLAPDSIWGRDLVSLWARGEGLMVYAPTGLGKTTLSQLLVKGLLGMGSPELLGYPINGGDSRVLIVAADRPRQALRSLRRMVDEEHRDVLDERLVLDVRKQIRVNPNDPESMSRIVADLGVNVVVIDSLKDVVSEPSTDRAGGAYNDAMQYLIASGVDVLTLHHPRKAPSDGRKSLALDDVYGSTWFTAGQGSVIALQGTAGTGVIRLSQLKAPADEVRPFDVEIDYATGEMTAIGVRDIETFLDSLNGQPATTREVTEHVTGNSHYTDTERKATIRRLNHLSKAGEIEKIKAGSSSKWRSDTPPDTLPEPLPDTPPDMTGPLRPDPY
jgi:replicative DNA helicase